MKIFLYHIGFRCRVGCRDMFLSDNSLNGADQTNLISGILKDGFHHIGCGCFSLGSGDTDGFELFCRMSEPCCGNKGHGVAGILYLDHCHILRCLHRFFHDKCLRTLCHNIRYEFMSIHNRTSDADKKAPFFYFTGIIYNRRNLLLCTSLKAFVFKMFQ